MQLVFTHLAASSSVDQQRSPIVKEFSLTWLSVLTEPIVAKIRARITWLHGGLARTSLALTLLFAVGFDTLAQTLPFPQPEPTTAAQAAAQFAARATAVIETNACGREDAYLRFREEMRTGNFKHQGEELIHILIAKMAYVRAHINAQNDAPCTTQILRERKDFEEHGRVAQFFGPAACAEETHENLVKHTDPTEPITVKVTVHLQCMLIQVDNSIKAMQKKTRMGTSGLPCISRLRGIHDDDGEWDVNVRELVRMLYLSGLGGQRQRGRLDPSTIDYMYKHLLAARGKLSDASYSVVLGCDEPAGDELGSPEDTADRHAWFKEFVHDLGDFFEWAVLTYLTYGVVPGAGALIAAPFLLTATGGGELEDIALSHWDIRIPETENHRLNIETSKFLTNADIIARLEAENYDSDLVDELREEQKEVRIWLLQRLQDIARHDFQEFNARPYTRYSLNSILNLHDFAAVHGDKDLARAALIVLDLSEAKFAATSNRGRRIVPFRRRSNEDGDDKRYLYESINASDHEVSRAMLLSGQTQTLDTSLNDDVGRQTLGEMVNAATSNYRLPPQVLVTAVERGVFEQTIRHTGMERVEQSPAFTISAGGVRTVPTARVSILQIPSDIDRGVAMPTVIIPTNAGSHMGDLFRFEGIGVHHERTANTCVAPGFACGLQPRLSTLFMEKKCIEFEPLSSSDTLFFVSSAECSDVPGPHFYLAGRILGNNEWGLMEIVEATPPSSGRKAPRGGPDQAYILFKFLRGSALKAVTLDSAGRGTYLSSGHRIVFGLREFDKAPAIVSIDGKPPPAWVTSGGVIDADGIGHAIIKGPGVPVVIDFTDAFHPKRTP